MNLVRMTVTPERTQLQTALLQVQRCRLSKRRPLGHRLLGRRHLIH